MTVDVRIPQSPLRTVAQSGVEAAEATQGLGGHLVQLLDGADVGMWAVLGAVLIGAIAVIYWLAKPAETTENTAETGDQSFSFSNPETW